jgi:hypothetical protein
MMTTTPEPPHENSKMATAQKCVRCFFPDAKSKNISLFLGNDRPKKTKTPTPYALAAAFTAEDNGAIDPGDNPVAFFTQLSDVFLDDEGIFCVCRVCAGQKKTAGRAVFCLPAGRENFKNL